MREQAGGELKLGLLPVLSPPARVICLVCHGRCVGCCIAMNGDVSRVFHDENERTERDGGARAPSRVRQARLLAGLTQQEAANRAGIHRTAWGSIERGEASPQLRTANAIADALGVDRLAGLFDATTAAKALPAVRISLSFLEAVRGALDSHIADPELDAELDHLIEVAKRMGVAL
jgi:transcriptional regulator with XRE-family HTH domain